MTPEKIIVHKKSRTVEIIYTDNNFILPAAYLRTKSTSASNKNIPSLYKPDIVVNEVHLVGNYAVQIYFSDGHNSGIYSWEYIRALCVGIKNEMARQKTQQKQNTSQNDIQVLNITEN